MFTKAFTVIVLAAASALAAPITDLSIRGSHEVSLPPRFNDWHGLSSLHGFDNFYGWRNFAGVSHRQVVLKQKHQLVCHTRTIEIIQQRLVVLQELAKKIVTEQICEVETQTIVFKQFHAGLGSFHHDLRRRSGRHVGYDAHIAGLYHGLFDEHGSLSTHDLGFRGHDIGKHVIVATGHDWDDHRSPPLVESAYDAARKAVISSDPEVEEDSDIPEVSATEVPDAEVTDAADAPGPEESDAADADADVAAETASASASASATVAAPSASASSGVAAANADPATAP